ncbi:MAG: hypothetical protein ACTSYX_12945, partial [Candidatus Thorarchaeota archaeon]
GSEKGYFNAYFYPQDSSYGYRSSGYIYTSFRKTAKLWWGPFQGGHGAVYATIDGQSDGYPIAECDNASRVIKYVAVLGYCYSSYDVVEMRVHDIRVIADLNRHDPTVQNPSMSRELDGTREGVVTADGRDAADAAMTRATDQYVRVFWSTDHGWPVLNLQVLNPVDTTVTLLHLGIDILNVVTLYRSTIDEWVLDAIAYAGNKVGYVMAVLTELVEMGIELLSVTIAMRYALAAWALVDTVKFLDLSMTSLVSSIAVATLLTAVFLGTAYSLTAAVVEVFGYPEAGVVWTIVLVQALVCMGLWLLGKTNLDALAHDMLRVYGLLCFLYGPFPDPTFVVFSAPWLDWATILFLLGTVALAAGNIYYYFTLA